MSRELLIWWLALSLVAVFNMYAWTLSARHLAVVWCGCGLVQNRLVTMRIGG